MAEVAAVIGLVAAIAQFVEYGSKLITRLNELSSADADRPNVFTTLKVRLTAVLAVVKQIQTRCVSVLEPEQMLPIIENTIAHIAQLLLMFDKAVPPPNQGRIWQKYVRAMKSLSADKAVQRLSTRIQDNIQIISLFQTTSLVDSSHQIMYGHTSHAARLTTTKDQVSVVAERQSDNITLRTMTSIPISQTQIQTTPVESQASLNTSSSSSSSIISTSGSQAPCLSDSDPTKPTSQNTETISSMTNHRCHTSCSCICHRPYLVSTPAILGRFFGRLSIDILGNALLHIPCNERKCQRRRDISAHMTYQLPGWMLHRMVRISIRSTALNTHINLNTMRILPDSAEIFSVVSRGDLGRLQSMFATQQASIYDVSRAGWTLVHTAFTLDRRPITQFLIDQGADLTIGAGNGSNVIERAWLQAQKSSDRPGEYIVTDSPVLREIDLDDFVSQQQYNLVHKAVLGITKLDLCALLDSSTADIDGTDIRGYTPLRWASVQGNLGAIQTLLDHGASHAVGSCINQLPLHVARNAAVVHLLHEGGTNIDAVDTSGRTALHCFCYRQIGSSDAIVRAVLQCGADFNARAYGQQTPLHYAVMFGNDSLVAPLIEFGADVDATMRGGMTPLLASIRYDQASCVARLFEHHADPTCRNSLEQSVLHLAAQHAGVECMNVLADGAAVCKVHMDTDARDDLDRTAQMYYDMREGKTEDLDKAFQQLTMAWRGKETDQGNAGMGRGVEDEVDDGTTRYGCGCDEENDNKGSEATFLVEAYTMPGSFVVYTPL